MKFVHQFPQETACLRDLLKNDTSWIWDTHHDPALLKIKELLQPVPILQFFDKNKQIVLFVDASSFGLCCVLLQECKPVAYVSANLN